MLLIYAKNKETLCLFTPWPEHLQNPDTLREWHAYSLGIHSGSTIWYLPMNKKLSYRRGTARCVVSVEILPIATQQCRNYMYKSWLLNKSKLWSWKVKVGRCVTNMCTQPWHESLSLSYRCHKQTDDSRVVYITRNTDDFLWRNFLSPQCRNCSRDPDHAHLGNTHSSEN